jgi:hypothetical protein
MKKLIVYLLITKIISVHEEEMKKPSAVLTYLLISNSLRETLYNMCLRNSIIIVLILINCEGVLLHFT